MTTKRKFAIPTLLAAGLTPLAAAADDDTKKNLISEDSLFAQMKGLVASIGESHQFTLAQHQSHYSHSSHGSHLSHRSYGYRLPLDESVPEPTTVLTSTRNETSTPFNSVLPSSPAIAKKLKILPGNSTKFRELVMRTQIALFAKGYQVGEVNGELHARTVAALYHYQGNMGQIPSGKITSEVLSSLGIVAQ